ncbi:CoA transferase [Paraburkholderia sp. Cy-641]|uniref:CaiB/BaiF CoA transferase family protein n=1 Tax=Paraburkholderia sp. Cy-641 TaxID=2608337 RepID=UPI001421D579|nr:CoA transferase [Paraburkholderia sp. Cy-641]NIF81126.1 CoA transferase [Paraburkholderia sp. Cy-641]
MGSALEGMKVLDFTQMMNGPFGTMLLADFGADVIKVEPPVGDTMRLTGETFLGDDAVYFLTLNRNKRSVIVDLATPEGQRVAQEMAKQVDIVVENFRPGVAEKLGISYETLSALNPRLIYCSTSAFGRTGEDSYRPGMDPVVQAMSGIMQLTGDENTGPLKTGMPYSDLITPLLSTIGVLAAVQSRNKTGRGQRVDLSMIDATIFSMIPRDAYYFATGETPGRIGNAHWQIVPYNTYRTSDDRHIMVIAHTDKFWRVLASAVGATELLDDERLKTKDGRLAHRDVVDEGLAKAFARESLAHWNEKLREAHAMFSPVLNFEEVFEDPRVQEDLVVELDHPKAGKFKVVTNPIRLSETPPSIRRPPPVLGQHTEEILREFGIKTAQAQPASASAVLGNE